MGEDIFSPGQNLPWQCCNKKIIGFYPHASAVATPSLLHLGKMFFINNQCWKACEDFWLLKK
jgi:hypothetical protein